MNLIRYLSGRAPDPAVRAIRPFYYKYTDLKLKLAKFADAYRIIGPDDIYSEEYFEKRKSDPWWTEARHISSVIDDQFSPNSVIDFGCAIGHYLKPFHEEEATIKGVEGSDKARKHLVIPENKFESHDLRDPYRPEMKYDLALCFEVAEHLPRKYADTLVKTVTSSSDTIIFTAAQPGQGGDHHVHLRSRDYWIEMFEDVGFEYSPDETQTICQNVDVDHLDYMQENLFIFQREIE